MQSQPSGVPFGNIRLCLDKTASPDFFMTKLKFDIYFLFICFLAILAKGGLDITRLNYDKIKFFLIFGYFSKRWGWTR